jgi:hypothetical protein
MAKAAALVQARWAVFRGALDALLALPADTAWQLVHGALRRRNILRNVAL